jgi:DnaD/phage-associated family protein
MAAFHGFSDSESSTQFPDSFFGDLLAQIEDIAELKVALFALWGVEQVDGTLRALSKADFSASRLGLAEDAVGTGLDKAVHRGILLRTARGDEVLYFLNSPRGRAAVQTLSQGGQGNEDAVLPAPLDRPNVFRLYEENIGPLTPLIADALKDAEESFSSLWTAEAIELAAKHNKRNWKYCEAILKRWKEEGRGEQQNTRDDQESRQRDVERKIKRFIRG